MSMYVYAVKAKVLNVHVLLDVRKGPEVIQARYTDFLCRANDRLHAGATAVNKAETLYERKGVAEYIYTDRGNGVISVWVYNKMTGTFFDDTFFGDNTHVCYAQKVKNKWTAMTIKEVAELGYKIMCEKMEAGELSIHTHIGKVKTVMRLNKYLGTFESEGDKTRFLIQYV